MTVTEIMTILEGTLATPEVNLEGEATSGFVGDLLSVVMGKAQDGCAWVTIQSHINIVAVASLVDMACIIVAEGFKVDADAVAKAQAEAIPIITTPYTSYEAVAKLASAGLV